MNFYQTGERLPKLSKNATARGRVATQTKNLCECLIILCDHYGQLFYSNRLLLTIEILWGGIFDRERERDVEGAAIMSNLIMIAKENSSTRRKYLSTGETAC